MILKVLLMLVRRLVTAALYEKVAIILLDDALGYLVKRTSNKIDDKLHAAILEALKNEN